MDKDSPASTDETPWDQTADFLEATDTVVRPGGPTAYIEPRPVGSTPTDVTGFVPGQAAWTSNDWPNILYTLRPPPGWEDFRQSQPPPVKRDSEGNIIYESNPLPAKPGKRARKAKPLRDFSILPDIIGTRNPWWYYEAIRRIDPRVCWNDILMRMPLEGRRKQNALNMESSRMRPRYKMVSWHPTSDRSKENEIRQRVMKNLTPQQIAANTTRRSTPGLINPLQGEAGGRIPHLALRNGQGQVRGSRPTRPKIIKKPNKSTRPDEAIDEEDEEHDEEDAEEQDKVHEEPQSEASPYPSTNDQITRQAITAIDGRERVPSNHPQARPCETHLPPFDYLPSEVKVAEEHAPRKRKRAVDAFALTDDEEIVATVNHLSRRRVAARPATPHTLNTAFNLGGRLYRRDDSVERSVLNQRMGTVRPPDRVSFGSQSSGTLSRLGARVARHVPPHEETESVRRRNRTSFEPSQLEGQNYSAPPCHHDQSVGQSRASYANRPGRNDSLRMGGRRSMPMAGDHSLSPTWEYDHNTAMHRRVADDAHLTNPNGVIQARSYYEYFSAFQAQQDRVTRQPIHTAASRFNFDPVQSEVSTRYTNPPLLLTDESRNLWSGEEDVVWGNRNSMYHAIRFLKWSDQASQAQTIFGRSMRLSVLNPI